MTLREVGAYLPGDLPPDLHSPVKFRLAQLFQMIDELDLADSSTGETGAGWAGLRHLLLRLEYQVNLSAFDQPIPEQQARLSRPAVPERE